MIEIEPDRSISRGGRRDSRVRGENEISLLSNGDDGVGSSKRIPLAYLDVRRPRVPDPLNYRRRKTNDWRLRGLKLKPTCDLRVAFRVFARRTRSKLPEIVRKKLAIPKRTRDSSLDLKEVIQRRSDELFVLVVCRWSKVTHRRVSGDIHGFVTIQCQRLSLRFYF